MNYLISVVEVFRVPDMTAADALEEEFRKDSTYELTKIAKEERNRKQGGEIVEEWIVVKTMKVFNDMKAPDNNVQPNYR